MSEIVLSNSPIDNFYPHNLDEFIIPKNELLVNSKKSKAVELILKELQKIPNYELYRTNLEFLKMGCNFVENMIVKSDGINKLDVIVEVFIKLFQISSEEQQILKTNVEFLLNNKRIKKITFIKKTVFFLVKIIKTLF